MTEAKCVSLTCTKQLFCLFRAVHVTVSFQFYIKAICFSGCSFSIVSFQLTLDVKWASWLHWKNIFHVNWLLWLTIKARLFTLILWLNNLEDKCYNNESLCLSIGNTYCFFISCFLLFRLKTLLLFISWTSLKYQTSTRCTSCTIPVLSCFSSGTWWFWNVTHLNCLSNTVFQQMVSKCIAAHWCLCFHCSTEEWTGYIGKWLVFQLAW